MPKSVLITGAAGSGKTAYCLRVCEEAMKKYPPGSVVHLVPGAEAVRDIERALSSRHVSRVLVGSVVMDFVGAASRILKEGGCFPVRRIARLGKSYLIHRIVRKAAAPFFENVKDYDGFAEAVGDLISELKRAMISPEDFLDGSLAATGPRGVPEDKVLAVHAIYSAYQEVLKDRHAYDGDGLQWMAAEVLAADPSLLSSVQVLIVDGFATYTPVEMEMLALLLNRVGEAHLTLCYERERPDVFGFVQPTHDRLTELCSNNEMVLSANHLASRELLHLERNLFSEDENQVEAGRAVHVNSSADPYDEIETVARQIESIRLKDGLSYSDFMVLVRDTREYHRVISEVFEERRIPFSIPSSVFLAEEPFITSVVTVLRLVGEEFRSENVLAALKNSYVAEDQDVAAAIENYVDEHGLYEEDLFRQPWKATGESTRDVSSLDDHKARFLATLDRLRAGVDKVSTAEQFRGFVFSTIREMGFLGRRALSENGQRDAATPENSATVSLFSEFRALGALVSVLDRMCEYARLMNLPDADYRSFLDMLDRGLSSVEMPRTARAHNSVRVTSIVGSPPRPACVVFICGLCERSFPREIANEPFFKDRERQLINRRGKIALGERLALSSGERFFFYIAVSRAAHRLILSYPRQDAAGNELVPSHYLEEVTRLFSDLVGVVEDEFARMSVTPSFGEIADADQLRDFVASHFSRKSTADAGEWDEDQTLALLAYNERIGTEDLHSGHLIYQPPATDQVLLPDVCQPLKKDPFLTSVSRLETFARCPFRHFCEYTLHLKEPPRYEFTHREEGILYHEVLAHLYREIYLPADAGDVELYEATDSRPRGIDSVSEQQLVSRLKALADQFINEGYARLFQNPRMEVRRRSIERRIRDFLLKEMDNEHANATRPAYFELSFGRGKSKERADARSTGRALLLETEGSPVVLVSGRMDRVDVFEAHEERFGVVLDYKRSGQRAKPDLTGGTVLQAGLYMLALKNLFNVKPAGAFYYSISSARKRGIFAAEEEERISGHRDVSRADKVSYGEIGDLMELNASQAVEYVRRIQQGDIGVKPADPQECHACPFASLCRIGET